MKTKLKYSKGALEREKAARKQAEKILENKSIELYELTNQLKATNSQLEEILSEKTSELKGVFENIVDAYVMMDLWGNVLKMNEAAKDLLGYDIDKESFNLLNLVHKKDQEYTAKAFQDLYKNGSFTDYQARIITKKEEVKLVHVNSSIIYNKYGKAIAAQGIVRDITSETQDREIFERQKRQLDIIVENSPLGIVLTSNGTIIKSNKTFQQFLGYSGNELKGKKVKELTFHLDSEETKNNMNSVDAGKAEGFAIKKRYLRKDNTVFDAKTTVSVLKNSRGTVEYQVAMIEDITQQIANEKQKEQLLLNLERSNEELKNYAHIVSHDLKSPLRSIEALISWLKEDYGEAFDDKGLEYVQMLEDKIENMDHLIDGILKYSSINAEDMHKEDVDVNEILEDIIDTIYIPEHVEVKIVGEMPQLRADRTRMYQLFQNIISNGVNYIENKKGLVEVACEDEKNFWLFSIRDNGIGIPKEYHNKVFKIFQSFGSYNKSSGIGLSIVKKIIDVYQGRIWLESEENKGTTFFIKLKKEMV